MVDPASDFLMSSFALATIAPNSRVIAPTIATTSSAVGAPSYTGPERTTRYTPAVTMVAAWISADTGVGPAIASPSQDCSGNCADLPVAPSSSSRPIAVSTPSLALPAEPSTVAKSVAPKVAKISAIATIRPRSPTRLATNAFLAATALGVSWFQNPISR